MPRLESGRLSRLWRAVWEREAAQEGWREGTVQSEGPEPWVAPPIHLAPFPELSMDGPGASFVASALGSEGLSAHVGTGL